MNDLPLSPNSIPGPVLPPLVWGQADLRAAVPSTQPWLWQGYLAPGAVTLLSGRWKAGKTTLLSILLARLKTGGELAGLPLAAGKAIVVSEESPQHWLNRSQRLDFGDHVGWFCRPFLGRPSPTQWQALIEAIAGLRDSQGIVLVAIDALASFYPSRSENNAACMMEALAPLQHLTRRGLCVLVSHHPAKGDPPVGQLARGSGALSAAVDILLELRYVPKAPLDDRRRWLQALSRYPETLRQKVIELSADGTDYLCRGTFQEEEFAARWAVLRPILAAAGGKCTREEIRRCWPGAEPPDRVSLSRWLERAVDLGLLRKDGRGFKNDPFRYWLPGREAASG
jgi:hypothetical protein